jgi:hypothetical protein
MPSVRLVRKLPHFASERLECCNVTLLCSVGYARKEWHLVCPCDSRKVSHGTELTVYDEIKLIINKLLNKTLDLVSVSQWHELALIKII